MSVEKRWVIQIGGGYGSFLFSGTAEQAEEMRSHKANWEHAVGKKRLADRCEVTYEEASNCWNHPGFKNKFWYFCECGECDNEKRERTVVAHPFDGEANG